MTASANDFTFSFMLLIVIREEWRLAPVLNRQFFPALGTPAFNDLGSARGAHPC